jgi:hypothetical protein
VHTPFDQVTAYGDVPYILEVSQVAREHSAVCELAGFGQLQQAVE